MLFCVYGIIVTAVAAATRPDAGPGTLIVVVIIVLLLPLLLLVFFSFLLLLLCCDYLCVYIIEAILRAKAAVKRAPGLHSESPVPRILQVCWLPGPLDVQIVAKGRASYIQ